MTKLDIAWGALAFCLAVVAGPAAAGAEPAQANYRLYCVQCHGSLGTGAGINQTEGGLAVSPRDHTDAAAMSKLSDEEIKLAISDGGDAVQKSELMPPWGQTLTPAEIDGLVRHLRALCKCEAAD
jgi:cytochrome c oxidase cbb3-type subunit 3